MRLVFNVSGFMVYGLGF